MPEKHPWTFRAHDVPDFFPHIRLIAVHRAFGASGLVVAMGTMLQAFGGIVHEQLTLLAKLAGTRNARMHPGAMHPDHRFEGLEFPCIILGCHDGNYKTKKPSTDGRLMVI